MKIYGYEFNKADALKTLEYAAFAGLGAALAYVGQNAAMIDPLWGPAVAALATVAAKAIQRFLSDTSGEASGEAR